MAPLLSLQTAASPAGDLSTAGGFWRSKVPNTNGLSLQKVPKWFELCPCTGCPHQTTPQGVHTGTRRGLVTSLTVPPQPVPFADPSIPQGAHDCRLKAFPLSPWDNGKYLPLSPFTLSGTGLGRAEMCQPSVLGPSSSPCPWYSPQCCSSKASEQSLMPSQCLLVGMQVPLGHWKPLHFFSEMQNWVAAVRFWGFVKAFLS